MSRIGNKTITIPEGVTISVTDGNEVTVKGPKGELKRVFSPELTIDVKEGSLHVSRPNDEKRIKQLHGTTRALIHNMVEGVHGGFKKTLELVGIGYRANVTGKQLTLNVGYSHPVVFDLEEGVDIVTPTATVIEVSGIDKQRVGEWAANIRAVRAPEPYLGKGIRYRGEHIRRKEGKTSAKK